MAQPISEEVFCNQRTVVRTQGRWLPAERGWDGSEMLEHIMSDEFDGLDAIEKAAIGAALNRCRALATKIANELRNKRPAHFADKLSLADIHASLERAADVLSTVKGSRPPTHTSMNE